MLMIGESMCAKDETPEERDEVLSALFVCLFLFVLCVYDDFLWHKKVMSFF